MPRNIEIKARVRDPEGLRARVKAVADRGPVEIRQEDTFFALEHGRLKLRRFREDDGELIYYERPDIDGPKLCHYEISRTSEPEVLQQVLSAACGVRNVVRKTRDVYLIGRTRVHVDEVESLGSFVELEVVLGEDEAAWLDRAAELPSVRATAPDFEHLVTPLDVPCSPPLPATG